MTRREMQCAAAASMMALASACATAHVTLTPKEVVAGSRQTLNFQVTGGCQAGQRVESVTVDLPMWFRLDQALPRAGWALHRRDTLHKNGPLGRAGAVYWSLPASAPVSAGAAPLQFALQGRLPTREGALPFTVRQSCTDGREVIAKVQVSVRKPAEAPVHVSLAWVRTPAAGERNSILFMSLNASEPLRLVNVFSPAARRIEVRHTLVSKLESMSLIPAQAIELPAGTVVRLGPGGVQLAVLGLAEPLAEGSMLSVTLRFEDAAGAVTEKTVDVPVQSLPPSQSREKKLGLREAAGRTTQV